MENKSIRVNIILPIPLYDEFKQRCEFAGVGMATVVRHIIEREIASPVETAHKKRQPDPVEAVLRADLAEKRKQEILTRRLAGERPADLAREFGMTISGISKIVARSK